MKRRGNLEVTSDVTTYKVSCSTARRRPIGCATGFGGKPCQASARGAVVLGENLT